MNSPKFLIALSIFMLGFNILFLLLNAVQEDAGHIMFHAIMAGIWCFIMVVSMRKLKAAKSASAPEANQINR